MVMYKIFITLLSLGFFNQTQNLGLDFHGTREIASTIDKINCLDLIPQFLQQKILVKEFPLENIGRKHLNRFGSDYVASTKSFKDINKKNFDQLFSHQYDPDHPDVTGIKAITYQHLDGDLSVSFWSTGIDGRANHLHHRDALTKALEAEAKKYDQAINPNEEKWFKINAEKDSLENLGRNHQAYAKNLLSRAQGFQLTAKETKLGGIKKKVIVYLDIDSSITSAQISQNNFPGEETLASDIAHILNRIDPLLLQLKAIRLQGLEETKIDAELLMELIKKKMRDPKINLPTIIKMGRRDMRGAFNTPQTLFNQLKLTSHNRNMRSTDPAI